MQPIKNLLNKIKWDKRENPNNYSIYYYDRISKKLIKINYMDIKKFEDNFIVLETNGKESYIPMHRIKEVRKNNILVWKR
ncbi:DUF504 domain-containing protein [Candidatus Woesearchaeota archaeon]|nr:DUF504 domain-containing protein [Candidatus Woesearchaeota archaeon]